MFLYGGRRVARSIDNAPGSTCYTRIMRSSLAALSALLLLTLFSERIRAGERDFVFPESPAWRSSATRSSSGTPNTDTWRDATDPGVSGEGARGVFRNLGWSGDTMRGEARAGFGQPADGFNRLAKHVAELKPNVIFLSYGARSRGPGRQDSRPLTRTSPKCSTPCRGAARRPRS